MSRLLTPRWIIAHVVVLIAAVVLVSLGVWQWGRYEEVSARADRVEGQLGSAATALSDIPVPGDATATEELEFTRVAVRGTYRPDDEVLLRSRSHEGRNGWHVLTPLETESGRGILVRRGWVPYELDQPPVSEAAPPDGEVEVTGFLQASDRQPGFGPTDPIEGELERMFHADVTRIEKQLDLSLHPMILQLESQTPTGGELPLALGSPELDPTTHLSYAGQWFSFAVVLLGGYGFWLRRRVRDDEDERVTAAASVDG